MNISSRILRFFFIFGIGLIAANSAEAQPTVILSAEASSNYRSVIFTFTQDDIPSMTGCHYNLFAADRPGNLRSFPGKAISIATFFKPLPVIQIIASPLPHIVPIVDRRSSRVLRRPKVYFRVLLSCPAAVNGLGEIISIPFHTYRHGKSMTIRALTKQMKFNMRYYNPV